MYHRGESVLKDILEEGHFVDCVSEVCGMVGGDNEGCIPTAGGKMINQDEEDNDDHSRGSTDDQILTMTEPSVGGDIEPDSGKYNPISYSYLGRMMTQGG